MADEQRERFAPTSGRVMGAIGLALAVGVAGVGLLDRDAGFADWVVALAILGAVLVWAAVLRPRVSLGADDLELRNMLETVTIPLAAVEELAVRQLLAVRAGDRRYVCPAVGKSRRKLRQPASGSKPRAGRRGADASAQVNVDYADFVEARIRQRMEDARAALGIRVGSQEQLALGAEVRRSPAWPELVGVVLLSLVTVALMVL